MNLKQLLSERFSVAFAAATGQAVAPVIQLAGKPEFGDYQANGAMGAGKRLKQNPRAIAEQVIASVQTTIPSQATCAFEDLL